MLSKVAAAADSWGSSSCNGTAMPLCVPTSPPLPPHPFQQLHRRLLRPKLVLPFALMDGLAPAAPLGAHHRVRVRAEVQKRLPARQVDCRCGGVDKHLKL